MSEDLSHKEQFEMILGDLSKQVDQWNEKNLNGAIQLEVLISLVSVSFMNSNLDKEQFLKFCDNIFEAQAKARES